MNPLKPARIEWITFFVIMPFLDLLLNYLLFKDKLFSREVVLNSFPVIFIYGFVSWYFHILAMHLLRMWYPDLRQTVKRVFIILAVHVALTSSTLYFIFWSYDHFHFLGYVLEPSPLKFCVLIGIGLTGVATSMWEGSYIFQQWKKSMNEKELLQKMNLQHEFDALKNQVNPHFLFNSLNSLSSLIQENPGHAEKFLDEMSKVYRYILNNNKQELIDLGTEIRFLHSYHHLLKTRYNEGLNLDVRVEGENNHLFLPPLTLQLLLENAVKHNLILKEQPLNVSVHIEDEGWLVVKNNLQKKSSKIISNKVGLANIAMKYKILDQPEITVSENENEFVVRVPLIK